MNGSSTEIENPALRASSPLGPRLQRSALSDVVQDLILISGAPTMPCRLAASASEKGPV
jgi:hypothetical protein